MKVMFVCRGNTGRSQVAMEYFKQLSNGKAASSGTIVDNPGQLLKDREGAKIVIQAMQEHGIDMSNNPRTQLTPDVLKDYDKIIVMAEPETIPAWLSGNPKVEVWNVLDIKDQPIEVARQLRDQIRSKVEALLGYPSGTKQ